MFVPSLAGSAAARRNEIRSDRGFSLIELMVAVTILSLLFLVAVPTYQRLQRKARTASIVNDLRVFGAALQAHAHDTGAWPPEAAAGVVPTGMSTDEFNNENWMRPTAIGGHYDWEYNQLQAGVRFTAAITITGTPDAPIKVDYNQMLDIDKAIDDGDLTTGNFRLGFGDSPLYIIEQ